VFPAGFADRLMNAHPVTNCGNLTERHTGLGHAEWTGIHAEEDNLPRARAEPPEITFMGCRGVFEGVVNVSDWLREAESTKSLAQLACGSNEGGIARGHQG
jgi:hypothetical protein